MNDKKMIALDLDGTLLSSDKTITTRTISYLKELEERGYLVCLTSGRPPRSVISHMRRIGLKKSPVIAFNGDYIYDMNDDSLKIFDSIPVSFIADFFKVFVYEKFPYVTAEDLENLYVNDKKNMIGDDDFLRPEEINVVEGKMPNILKGKELYEVFFKCYQEEGIQEKIKQFTKNYEKIAIRFWYDEPDMGEFYLKNVSKATALQYIQNKYGISKENTIAIGDGNNDFEMIEFAYHSFAMKNGNEHLKSASKYITQYTNDEEGVYHALYSLLH